MSAVNPRNDDGGRHEAKCEVPYLSGTGSGSSREMTLGGYAMIGPHGAQPMALASGPVPRLEWTGNGSPALALATTAPGTSEALRIAHVGPCLLRGGAEYWLAGLARFLNPRRARIERCIVTMPDRIDPDVAAEMPGIPIETGGAEVVRRAVAECDILLCWGTPQLGRWLADCRPRLGVFVAHGEGDWTREILESCHGVIDHVVAVSERVRARVCEGVPCTTILNGIDSGRLAATRSRREVRSALGFGPEDFVLGFVGRFAQEKRVHVILDAIAGLPPRYKALLVGWGPLRSSLLDMANEHIPGRYAFVKATHYLGDYYQAMDATCLISQEEGFALVMLEAMMCGRPMIATPVGAVPEVVIDRVNGLIVPGTAESIRNAAELLHDHPDWARGLAAEARTFAVENGHARQMAARYEMLLHRLWRARQAEPAAADSHPTNGNGNGHTNGNGNGNGNGHSLRLSESEADTVHSLPH
jgi:glycosyltransferase involved in cell wall biosynthesis